jgi:UDP-N-acetylmuramoylalanine--D-glutamate ligase
MTDLSVEGRRIVVVGGARSGIAAAELLARRGARVTLTDLRANLDESARLQQAGIVLELGGHNPQTLQTADLIVLSPGVPPKLPALDAARRSGVPIVGELELASRWVRGRIVAITGTKGKSTTTTLTGRMFERAGHRTLVGGNIGSALSSQVDESTPDAIHVIEASSFQLETIETFHPWIAVFLNFSADHLDRHANEAEYADAKARIFANQAETDWAVVNADDPQVLALARRGRARHMPFALDIPLDRGIVLAGDVIAHRTSEGDVPLVPLASVRLRGRHLLSDVLAATAVGRLAGLSPEVMRGAVESFHGLEHALEPVAEIGGVQFVNDSKATNIEAARRAIESFDSGLVVIMGGRFKGGNLASLRGVLAARARAVIAIGEASSLIRDTFGDLLPVREAGTMAAAVALGFASAPPGGTVLLAPACASFDMFRDYAERGRIFKEHVRRLAEEVGGRREQ